MGTSQPGPVGDRLDRLDGDVTLLAGREQCVEVFGVVGVLHGQIVIGKQNRVEVEAFNALPPDERVAAFFRCWTRKEAYIKAIGKGLSQALDAFDVTLAPGVQAALLRAEEDNVERWEMSDVEVGEGYAGALAVERPVAKVKFFRQD